MKLEKTSPLSKHEYINKRREKIRFQVHKSEPYTTTLPYIYLEFERHWQTRRKDYLTFCIESNTSSDHVPLITTKKPEDPKPSELFIFCGQSSLHSVLKLHLASPKFLVQKIYKEVVKCRGGET